MDRMHIQIGVGGRFHADRMAATFLGAGHRVELFTTFPSSRFPIIPKEVIHSFTLPEVVFRLAQVMGSEHWGDQIKLSWFGKKMAQSIARAQSADLFIGWSSFSLETLRTRQAGRHVVVRDSAHIAYQYDLLKEEYRKFGRTFPDRQFCLERELEEYDRADSIVVLSDFAKKTFVEKGISASKVDVLRLGADTSVFHPSADRLAQLPLKAVYFGQLSIKKGIHYLLEATRDLKHLELTLVGSVDPDFRPLLQKYSHAQIHKPMAHPQLASFIREFDLFVFPTLEDGFGQTLIQAMASGLVSVVTDNCGAAERMEDAGVIVPIRDAFALRTALQKFIENPQLLPAMKHKAVALARRYSWATYSADVLAWAIHKDAQIKQAIS
ncbi:MAG: glycosyltransferase family 4 protein [Deltaproteobacteria bacterium]|nr:glycosyltransferase family 4 protein [Deltaproteobacteria bacterium]